MGELIYAKEQQELICPYDSLAFKIENGLALMLIDAAREISTEEKDKIRSKRKNQRKGDGF